MKTLLVVLIALGLTACASKQLTPEEAAVRILRKSDAPAECKELGKVMVYSSEAFTEQGRDNVLKRKAYALGGNLVTEDSRLNDGTAINGTAFNCSSKTAGL